MSKVSWLYFVAIYVFALSTTVLASKYHDRDDLSRWWDKSEILDQLELTEQQKSEIDEIALSNKSGLENLYTELKTSYKALGEKMGKADSTWGEIISAYNRLEDVHDELRRAKIEMMLTMRDILTLEQRTKLSAVQEQHEKDAEKNAVGKERKRGLLSDCM